MKEEAREHRPSITLNSGSLGKNPILERVLSNALKSITLEELSHYPNPLGWKELRTLIINTFRLNHEKEILITSSATEALNLIFSYIRDTQKTVAMHTPCFFGVARLLNKMSIQCHTWETIPELMGILQREQVGYIYVNSNIHAIHGQSLSKQEKDKIIAIAREYDTEVIEDNAADLLYFDETRPVTLIANQVSDSYYISGFSKILGPGLRIGFIACSSEKMHELKSRKITLNLSSPILDQLVITEALKQNYLPELRADYRKKWEAFRDLLGIYGFDFRGVEGGTFVTIAIPQQTDFVKLTQEARREGIIIEENKYYYPDGENRPYLRLNFIQNSREESNMALETLSKLIHKKTSPLKIMVTSGGTRVFIDSFRCITNVSRGTTGKRIAEEAVRRGHSVKYIYSEGAKYPFGDLLAVDTQRILKDPEAVMRMVKTSAEYIETQVKPLLNTVVCKDFDAYHRTVLNDVRKGIADVVILSMAASDFGPKMVEGKIDSETDERTLKLHALPKVISRVKQAKRGVFLVGFKALPYISPDALVEEAYRSLLRDKQDMVVANLVWSDKGFNRFVTYIVTLEKGIIPVPDRNDLDKKLLDLIEARFSRAHYHTVFKKVDQLPLPMQDIDSFIGDIRYWAHLALFPSFTQESRAEFGFVAKRTKQGTLITGRGSSKSQANEEDITLITEINEEKREIHVTSTGIKASLNGNLAHYIFIQRPEVNYIVHTHIHLPQATVIAKDTTPGTQEDLESIKECITQGKTLIYQQNHGMLILLKDVTELIPILEANNIYNNDATYYEQAYARFLNNDSFVDLIEQTLSKDARILDMCAGTGHLWRQLHLRGFSDITLIDASRSMLEKAQEKIHTHGADTQCYERNIVGFHYPDNYDGIVIRQAINYLAPDQLTVTLTNLRNTLKENGVLIFNTFIPAEHVPPSMTRSEDDDYIAITHEDNIFVSNVIHHAQRTELFNKETGDYHCLYDCNTFYQYSRKEFESSLNQAGFIDIKILQKKKALYFICYK